MNNHVKLLADVGPHICQQSIHVMIDVMMIMHFSSIKIYEIFLVTTNSLEVLENQKV